MNLREYREQQIKAIAREKHELEAIKSNGMRFYERTDSKPEEVEITDDIIDRRLRYIETLEKIVGMLDREIANGK